MIRNVIAVHRIQCLALADVQVLTMADLVDMIVEHGEAVRIVTPAKLTINNKVVDKNMLWDYSLVFKSYGQLTVRGHWVYALGLADGSWMVVGSKKRPYPITTSSLVLPDNLSDSQLLEVTVTWQDCTELPASPVLRLF